MSTTPGAAVLRRFYFAAASLAVCAVVDARSSVHLTCDNNLRINPPEGGSVEIGKLMSVDTGGSINSAQMKEFSEKMARMEGGLATATANIAVLTEDNVVLKADNVVLKADNANFATEISTLKQDKAALVAQVGALEAAAAATASDTKADNAALKIRVDDLEAAAGGSSSSDLDAVKADMMSLRSDVAELNTTTLDLVDTVHPNMSWCPDGAMHVNTEARWKGSVDGTGEDAVISEGVYCISDDVDFGSAVFFIKSGTTVQIVGRPIDGGGPMIAMRFGGVDVAKDAVLKMSHLSLQRLNRPGSSYLCNKDAAFIAAIKRGEVSGLSFGSNGARDNCLKGYQASCCGPNIDAYETWRGAGDQYEGVQGIIRVWGSLFLQDGEVAHTVANGYSSSASGELDIFAAYSGSISLTRLEIFDNAMGRLIYASTDSGRPASSEITMSDCTVIGAGQRGQPQFTGVDYTHGIIYAQGKSSSGKGSTITIKETRFRDVYTSEYSRVVATKDATVSIQSTTYENCVLSMSFTGSQNNVVVGC